MLLFTAQILLRIYFHLLTFVHTGAQDELVSSLVPQLSSGAQIFFPGTPEFSKLTSTLDAKKPQLDVVVKVATEKDIQHIVSVNESSDAFKMIITETKLQNHRSSMPMLIMSPF